MNKVTPVLLLLCMISSAVGAALPEADRGVYASWPSEDRKLYIFSCTADEVRIQACSPSLTAKNIVQKVIENPSRPESIRWKSDCVELSQPSMQSVVKTRFENVIRLQINENQLPAGFSLEDYWSTHNGYHKLTANQVKEKIRTIDLGMASLQKQITATELVLVRQDYLPENDRESLGYSLRNLKDDREILAAERADWAEKLQKLPQYAGAEVRRKLAMKNLMKDICDRPLRGAEPALKSLLLGMRNTQRYHCGGEGGFAARIADCKAEGIVPKEGLTILSRGWDSEIPRDFFVETDLVANPQERMIWGPIEWSLGSFVLPKLSLSDHDWDTTKGITLIPLNPEGLPSADPIFVPNPRPYSGTQNFNWYQANELCHSLNKTMPDGSSNPSFRQQNAAKYLQALHFDDFNQMEKLYWVMPTVDHLEQASMSGKRGSIFFNNRDPIWTLSESPEGDRVAYDIGKGRAFAANYDAGMAAMCVAVRRN